MDVSKNTVLPTVLLLTISATVGGIIALLVGLLASVSAAVLTGPLGWFIVVPAVIAGFSVAITWVIIGVPLLAVVGGHIFATNASGSSGTALRQLGVTLFAPENLIHIRANELARDAGLAGIKWVGWYPSEHINAMAIGKRQDNAMICLTSAAIEQLSNREVDAILAHEVAHVVTNDMQRMTYARGVQEALTFFLIFRNLKKFARWVFTPLSELYVLKFSREREFAADALAAELTSPEDMISALVAIHMDQLRGLAPNQYAAVQINGRAKSDMWSTHPGTLARIRAVSTSHKINPR